MWVWFLAYGILPIVILVVQVNSFAGGLAGSDIDTLAETIEDFGTIGVIGNALVVIAGTSWILFTRQLTDRHIGLTREA